MARFQLVVGKVEFVADNVEFVNRILEKSFVFSEKIPVCRWKKKGIRNGMI